MRTRSLSTTEARLVLSLEADGTEEVSLAEVRRRAAVSDGFARKLAHQLVAKGWLQRVRRGVYLLAPSSLGPDAIPDTDPLRAGSHLVEPYFFGFSTAAELLGLLPQASRTYYIVTPTRTRIRVRHAASFRLVRVARHRFFGSRPYVRRSVRIRVSDPERTLLDCLDRPHFAGGLPGVVRILESSPGRIDWSRVARYLRRWNDRTLAVRLGYLTELLPPSARPPAAWLREFRPNPEAPYVPLGSVSEFGRAGEREERWRVIRNVPVAHLFSEIEVR